jgi:hypothetical protein
LLKLHGNRTWVGKLIPAFAHTVHPRLACWCVVGALGDGPPDTSAWADFRDVSGSTALGGRVEGGPGVARCRSRSRLALGD